MAESLNVLTICTGFEDIQFDHLELREGQIKLGEQIYKAGHIFNVKEVRKPGQNIEITAHCIPQAKIAQNAYGIMMKLDVQRRVISIVCQCDFGSEGCKHGYALMLYMNTEIDR